MPTSLTTLFFLTIFIAPTITQQSVDEYNNETDINLGVDWVQDIARTDSAASMARGIGYEYGEAFALYLKGYAQDELNQAGKALLSNLSALRILEGQDSKKESSLKVTLYTNTGLILRQHFKYREAIQYFTEGLELAEEIGKEEMVAELYYKIGNAYRQQGNLELAIDFLVQAHNRSIGFEDDYLPVNSLNYLGAIYHENGDYDKARTYYQQIMDFEYRMVSESRYHGIALQNIADTYAAEKEYTLAEQYYLRSLEQKSERDRPSELFVTELSLFNLYLDQGKLSEASPLAELCKAHYEDVRKDPEHYSMYSSLRKFEFHNGNYEQAEEYASKFDEESLQFVNQQQELIQIRDQFKMDILTASYFSELERERRIANLTNSIYFIILFIFIGFTVWKIRQLYNRRILERELRTAIHDLNIDDL